MIETDHEFSTTRQETVFDTVADPIGLIMFAFRAGTPPATPPIHGIWPPRTCGKIQEEDCCNQWSRRSVDQNTSRETIKFDSSTSFIESGLA